MLVSILIPNLFGPKLGTWMKSHKLSWVFKLVFRLVCVRLFRKTTVYGTWKVYAFFQIGVSLFASNLKTITTQINLEAQERIT